HLVMKYWAVFRKENRIQAERIVLFDKDKLAYQLWGFPKKEVYTEISKELLNREYEKQMKQAEALQKQTGKMKALKGKIPKEQYEQMMAALDGNSKKDIITFSFKRYERDEKVGKWQTIKHNISRGSKHRTTLWMASLEDIGLKKSDIAIFKAMTSFQDFYDKVYNGKGAVLPLIPGMSLWSMIDGFPVKIQESGGPYLLRKVEKKTLTSSDKTPPSNMKKVR
ncbi:MAG: hypothetical protein NXH75_12385, partial [Halobacteriovoraceae bacterium]|nr:hypothetical protein [Halobacteriovoraceae bacterium]